MILASEPQAQAAFLAACSQYIELFAGRTDMYSVWVDDHWRAVRAPLTPEVVATAFETKIPLSAYVLDADSTTQVAAFDIDRDDGIALGNRILATVNDEGGVAYLEPSRRGCHLWIILTERQPGLLVRRGLKGLLRLSGIAPDPKIELRPAQDVVNDVGICIRMPSMPHQKTGQRWALKGSYGERLPGQITGLVQSIYRCDVALLVKWAELAPLPPLMPPPPRLRHAYGQPIMEERSASEILAELWGVPNARPGKAVRCPAHDDHSPSLSIARDDQRVWCKTGGCILSNDGRGRGTHELVLLAKDRSVG